MLSTLVCLFAHKRKVLDSYFSIHSNFYLLILPIFCHNRKTKRIKHRKLFKSEYKMTKYCIIILDENTIALDGWKLHGNMLVIVIYAQIYFWTDHLRDNINRRSRMQITNCFESKKYGGFLQRDNTNYISKCPRKLEVFRTVFSFFIRFYSF